MRPVGNEYVHQSNAHYKARVSLWDNARFLLIVTVVIGHFIQPTRPMGSASFVIYTSFYLFHMPAMIFISGYFARTKVTSKSVHAVIQLVAIYILWEAIMATIRYFVTGNISLERLFVYPSFALWFLFSLATMRLILPFLFATRYPLLLSIVIALLAGQFPDVNEYLSVARTLNLLPFLAFGYIVKQRGWLENTWFQNPSRRLKASAVLQLSGVIVMAYVLSRLLDNDWTPLQWLWWKKDYAELLSTGSLGESLGLEPSSLAQHFQTTLVGVTIHGALLLLIGLTILCFLIICPRKDRFYTNMGSRTMYIYLLHIPVAWLILNTDYVPDVYESYGLEFLGLLVVSAVGFSIITGTRTVARALRPIIEPELKWIYPRQQSKLK